MISGKFYLSDEGFGHIVRQRAVVDALRKALPDLQVTIQTHAQAAVAERYIADAKVIDRFNNIQWDKLPSGSPDLTKIKERFEKYIPVSDAFIRKELSEPDFDFLVSDFVYEAFEVATTRNTPSFGIAHFTWDWFFSKLYPPPVHTNVINRFISMADKATKLYFPPFTPEEIIHHYKGKAIEVPLILRSGIQHKLIESNGKFKVMIMDSGAGVLATSIKKALKSVAELNDYLFFVSDKMDIMQDNVRLIPASELMVDYVADMDLVIGRAGFNTISECIGLRTPMLLIGEAMNPEMNENILLLKKQNLGSFISMDTFEKHLGQYLPDFLNYEYKFIQSRMNNHEIETTGAEVIVTDMLNYL